MSYERIKKYRERNKVHIRQAKQKPCVDCDVEYPWYVMQFDHVPERGDKSFGLGYGQHGTHSLKIIDAEIAKCDVVCANCHAERTHNRIIDT